MNGIDWTSLFASGEVDDMAVSFCGVLNRWLEMNVPRVRPPVTPAWSTSRLRQLKRERNAFQRKLQRRRTTQVARETSFEKIFLKYCFKQVSIKAFRTYLVILALHININIHTVSLPFQRNCK